MVDVLTILGLDLGQSIDPAAAAFLEMKSGDTFGPPDESVVLRGIKRYPLGTDYYEVCRDVLSLGPSVIVPELNGVGRPFVDLLRREAMVRRFSGRICPIVTAPSSVRPSAKREARGEHWTVPKVELVSALTMLEQTRRLRLPDTPDVRALLREVAAFCMKITRAANQQYAAQVGEHDDMVMALCLAAWYVVTLGSRRLAVFC